MTVQQDYVIVYCRHDDYILIVNKDRPAWQKGRINLPGGKIDPEDPSPEFAAIRELKEESGYEPSDFTLAREVGRIESHDFKIHFIEIPGPRIEDPIQPRPGETEIVEWMKWKNLSHNPRLMPNLRVIIPLLLAGVEGWIIRDDGSSWGKTDHSIIVQVPTHIGVASAEN